MATKNTSFWTKVRWKAGDAREWAGVKWKGTKEAMLLGGLIAGGAMLMATSSRGGSRATPDLAPLPQIPPLLTPQDLMAQSPMMQPMEAGPMDGRPENYWQQTVEAQRGGVDQNRGNPAQPRMSAIAPESVGDMGAMPARA